MKMSALFPLLICCGVLAACSNSTDSTMTVRYTFDSHLSFTANSTTISKDRPLVVTIGGMPLVSGKGRIEMTTASRTPGGMMIVESPIHDTLITPKPEGATKVVTKSVMPFTFVANQRFSVPWQLSFTNIEHHLFNVIAVFDSIAVPDSGRLYPAGSVIVKQSLGIDPLVTLTTSANSAQPIEVNP